MTLWIVAWALWSLTVWYQVHFWLPARKAIAGCEHTHGTIRACNPDITGRPRDLVWFCSACGFQAPLKLHRIGPTLDTSEKHSLWHHAHDKDGR